MRRLPEEKEPPLQTPLWPTGGFAQASGIVWITGVQDCSAKCQVSEEIIVQIVGGPIAL